MAMRIHVLDDDLYAAELSGGFGPRQPGDAGLDLRSAQNITIVPGTVWKIPLGVALELDGNQVGWLTGRSSLSLTYGLLTHEGKIDSGYRGEVHAIVQAFGRSVNISRGERIVQIVVVNIEPPSQWEVAQELTLTQRGALGLGSTGRI